MFFDLRKSLGTTAEAVTISSKNNFDLLRIIFASSVATYHMYALSHNRSLYLLNALILPLSSCAVQGFFIISGFLIFRSFEQSHSLFEYIFKRFRRIYPGYFVVVMVCAITGLFFSHLSLQKYLFGVTTYLAANLLFLNFVQPTLPGVFLNNPEHAVNGSLWTIKIEVMFYLAVPLLVLLFRYFGRARSMFVLYLLSFSYVWIFHSLAINSGESRYLELSKQFPGQLAYFIAGAFLYYFFKIVDRNALLLLLISLLCGVLDVYLDLFFLRPFYLAFIIFYLAFKLPPVTAIRRHGDFSYGVYIYHFPVIQCIISLGLYTQEPITAILLTVLIVASLAYLSWTFIEKPSLSWNFNGTSISSYSNNRT